MMHFSQYYFNDYVLNPAVAGSRDHFEVRSNQRMQWVGITDAPRTFTLSAHGPLKNKNMGVGGYIYTDIVGPTRRIGFQGSYAYHLQLSDDLRLSLSLSGGLQQFAVDGSKITTKQEGDVAISSGVQSALLPDAKFGFHLYGENFFFGASAPQLLQNQLRFFDGYDEPISRLEDHYFAIAGYRFDITDDFSIEPAFMAKYVSPVPPQFDIMTRIIYKDQIWIGASFRTEDAFSAMLGFTYKDYLLFGYSFDFTTSNIQNHSSGTHEVVLGVNFIQANSVGSASFE